MSTAVAERRASPELVEQLVREVRHQLAGHSSTPLVIGVRAQSEWTHGDLTGEHGTIYVAPCATPLAVRDALAAFGSNGATTRDTLVVLTPLAEAELGADVLGRFVRPRLLYLNSWNAVCQRLGVRQLDPDYGTSRLAWMAEALLTVPLATLPPAMSTLSVDAGLQLLAQAVLGSRTLTVDGLLRATAEPGFADRIRLAADELVARLTEVLGERLGPAGRLVCGAIAAGHGSDALPAGLAAVSVVGAADQYAHAMVEAVTGCDDITDPALAVWARAAETALGALDETESPLVADLLTIGSQLVADWRAPHPEASAVLAAGFDARLALVARELDAFLDNRDGADLSSVRRAVADVRAHRNARTALSRHRAVRAELAARLALWLRDPISDAHGTAVAPAAGPATFGDVLDGYRADGAWVDAARRRVEEGDDAPTELAAVLARISEAAYERRRAGNQRFAQALAHWTVHGTATEVPDDGVVAVEVILEQVAVPLAAAEGALLVVLDGCGLPAFLELVDQFRLLGFQEIGRGGRRAVGLAALPTVTDVSRASLLCGTLTTGNAEHEKRGFVAQDAVRRLSGLPARLFHHRPDLTTGVGQGLPAEVLAALGAAGPRLVGAVVNTIDDELSRGDFTREYAIEHLGPLQGLLRAAADAGRYVIITADHGHVLGVGLDGRGDARRGGEGGDRWRDADRDLDDDEVLLRGPRVLRGDDRGVIAPAQDDLRYSAKHGGYHGGATPEECVVPLSVFRPPGVDAPPGWEPVSAAPPGWWDLAAFPTPPGAPETAPGRPRRRTTPAPVPGQGGLFGEDQLAAADEALTESTAPTALQVDAPWAAQLLASDTYQVQLGAMARMKPPPERVRAALGALHARGGTASFAVLAQATGMALARVPGFVAALERLLNVDGYGIVTVDRTAQEVRLDEPLLHTQFLGGTS